MKKYKVTATLIIPITVFTTNSCKQKALEDVEGNIPLAELLTGLKDEIEVEVRDTVVRRVKKHG